MSYKGTARKLDSYRRQIAGIREKMQALQATTAPEPVEDYAFATPRGQVRLSGLFGRKSDLIAIHNMGSSCPYCTLWADGFNGIYDHLANRAAFVVTSPDSPSVQTRFAKGRGWRFPMVSHAGTTFAADMGYRSKDGGWKPGVSVFKRENGRILRVSDATFSPGDDYCALWHLLDLLPGGGGDWSPKFRYR